MNAEMQEVCKKVFSVVDKEGRGKLSRDQMSQSLRLLGLNPTDAQLNAWLEPADSSEFNYDQYMDFVTSRIRTGAFKESRQDIRTALAIFDIDDTGCIDKELLLEVLTQHGSMRLQEEDAQGLVRDLDYRHDGKIRIAELEAIFVTDDDVCTVLSDQKWDHV